MSHQEATGSRSEKGKDSGDRKPQAQQPVFMCQLRGLKTVTKLGYSRSSLETCLSKWMGGGNDITWPRNQRGSWHLRDKSWMFLWSFKLDPQPAWLEGLIRLKKKATVLPHVHFVYTCTHAHVCTHTIPITKRMPGSLNREKSSTSLRVWVEASFDRSGTICEMFYLPASLFLSFTPQPSRNRTLCIQASI